MLHACNTLCNCVTWILVETRFEIRLAFFSVCIQCRTTLDSLLRKPPTILWWYAKHLQHQHAAALGSLIGSGALASVIALDISHNHVGDAGLSALASACADGALASLGVLFVDNKEHPALKAACQARGIDLY